MIGLISRTFRSWLGHQQDTVERGAQSFNRLNIAPGYGLRRPGPKSHDQLHRPRKVYWRPK